MNTNQEAEIANYAMIWSCNKRLWIYESHVFELRIKTLTWKRSSLWWTGTTWAVLKLRPEKKIQASTGFEPMTSSIPVQRFTKVWSCIWEKRRYSMQKITCFGAFTQVTYLERDCSARFVCLRVNTFGACQCYFSRRFHSQWDQLGVQG